MYTQELETDPVAMVMGDCSMILVLVDTTVCLCSGLLLLSHGLYAMSGIHACDL